MRDLARDVHAVYCDGRNVGASDALDTENVVISPAQAAAAMKSLLFNHGGAKDVKSVQNGAGAQQLACEAFFALFVLSHERFHRTKA